jgi:hypothetical protein
MQKATDPVRLDRPNNPKHKKDRGHCGSHIEVGVSSAQQGAIDVEHAGRRVVMAPADRPDPGKEAEPVYKQNKNEYGREEPERLADKIAPYDVFEKVIKTFHQPFPKILDTARDRLDSARRYLSKNENPHRHNPRHQHRVRDRKLADVNQLCWL